ncbi:hypothetical protein AAFC00_000046 [Neodothiora populina]|uniref:Dehydrin n=1 Tax=Neodothiora populina TaxID=2781224 RepID=A0ABR3P2G9_9PEZI
METIRNAANAAASYVGYDTNEREVAGEQLGELVSDRQRDGTVGTEPISGQLGSGSAGQPYDAGNVEDLGAASSSTGHQHGLGNTVGSSTGTNSVPAGYESTSGYGNNTGSQPSTSRGIGADATQQGNHYTTTTTAGKLPGSTGIDATREVGNLSGTTHSDRNSTYSQGSTSSGGNRSHLHGQAFGSDRNFGQSGDRYLFDGNTAPGSGGRRSHNVDDFTDDNIHNEGSGHKIISELGSDAGSGKAGPGAGNTGVSGVASGLGQGKESERSRKPGFGRQASGLGSGSYGLNSGKPRESLGHQAERKVEEYAAPAGLAGAGAYGASHSGKEPLSGVRGSGVAGEPYDQGNVHDGAAASQLNRGTGLDDETYSSSTGRPHESLGQKTERKVEEYAAPAGVAGAGAYGANQSRANDSQVSQATSGMGGLSLNERQRGHDGAYDVTNAGPYGSESNTTGGIPFPGSSTTGHSTTTSGFRGHGSSGSGLGAGGLEERIAGAPVPGHEGDEECVDGHHNTHPSGERAHEDRTHKPTFLDYQHDKFGVPVARGD